MNSVSPKQAAQSLGCSPKTVYRLFTAGELKGFKVRSSVRIFPASIDEYIERNSNAKPAPADLQEKVGDPSRKRQRPASPRFNEEVLIAW